MGKRKWMLLIIIIALYIVCMAFVLVPKSNPMTSVEQQIHEESMVQ